MESKTLAAFDVFNERKNMTRNEIADMFSLVANIYEDEWESRKYVDYIHVAEQVADYFSCDQAENVRILDVAAGTGLVAQELWKKGFRKLDGLDPAEGMRDEAMKKNIYTNYFLEFFDGKMIEYLSKDTFDCVVVSGGFNTGLLPCAALVEMVRLVKPGGLVSFCIYDSSFTVVEEYSNRLQPFLDLMEDDGVLELLDTTCRSKNDPKPVNIYRYIVRSSDVESEKYLTKLSQGF